MRAALLVALLGWIVAGCTTAPAPQAASSTPQRPPNILLIVADDLGYSDLGAYGGEIATPHIDALAASGRVFTNFHVSSFCSPTRARLMSGADHHRAGLGNMAEVTGLYINLNHPLNAPWGASNTYGFGNVPRGYAGHLPADMPTLAEQLRDAGYHTLMAGKWHLAYQVAAPDAQVRTWYRVLPDALPAARGFDHSFALMNGGAAHFAPPTPPTPPTSLDLVTYAEDRRLFPATELPKDFHSTKAFTDRLIAYIDANRSSGKPFFAYAAYTAPHWPLQAPDADIAAQKGRYDAGYEAVRERRIARMKQLGLIAPSMAPNPGVPGPAEGGSGPKRWAELDATERARQARAMEVYAAMVTNLDAHVGRLIAHLKATGEYERTLIVFMSDNGAEGAAAFAPPLPGTRSDNSLANLGRPGSVLAYGPRWAEVSSTPLRLFKGMTGAEGGTAAPLIVKLPGQGAALPRSDLRIQVTDLLPTLLQAAGAAPPAASGSTPAEGVSWYAAWSRAGEVPPVRPADAVYADELMGNAYVVQSRWKLSRQPSLSGAPVRREAVPWQLFDLQADPGETVDRAAAHPEVVARLQGEYERYVLRSAVIEQAQAYSGR